MKQKCVVIFNNLKRKEQIFCLPLSLLIYLPIDKEELLHEQSSNLRAFQKATQQQQQN